MKTHHLLKNNHLQCGTVLMTKCDKILNLFKEFYKIASENYNLIDDSPSKIPNNTGFIEHRHDQSIFSLLVKKYNLLNYDLDPVYWGSDRNNYILHGKDYPIWACRNRTGKSINY